jgi:hypothetical protein
MVDMEKMMTVLGPIIEKIVFLVTMLIPLAMMYFAGKYGFNWAR